MYKLLIVDDEYQTRRGLCELFDWESMNIAVAGDASDGDEALPLIEKLRPDILLTDVRMHRMDGLALARRARELLPGIGIVFISGYSDADYLKDALLVGAIDYLYKPIRLDELERTMKRLIRKLDQQAETRLLLETSKPLLAERFLRSWFHGHMDDQQAIRSKLDLLGMHFPEEGIIAAALQPQWEVFPEGGEAENCQILMEKTVRADMENVLTCAEDTGLTVLISAPDGCLPRQWQEALSAVQARIQEQIHTPVAVGVSRFHKSWLEAHEAVQEAQQAIDRQLLPDEDSVLFFDDASENQQASIQLLDGDLLERYLFSGNMDTISQMLDEMLLETGLNAALSRKLLMSIMLRADLALQQQSVSTLDSLAFCRQAMSYQSVPAIKNSLLSMLKKACSAVEKRREQAYSPAVERVMEIIRTRYADHLSVNELAEQVHYSSAHLSTVFRRETGLTLSEAILRTRLKAAMDLLQTTLEPVSAIASRCGYTDVQYFSRVFKQFTGFTPLEYRRKALSC